MDGVILFADDKIHTGDSPESKFFNALKTELPVVGVHTIELAEKTTSSIGTFSAVIMDWQFDSEEDEYFKEMGVTPKSNVSFDFLMKNDFYSLVYVYSERSDIEESQKGEDLKKKYKDRIRFSQKALVGDFESEKKRVLKEIEEWRNSQVHLTIPLQWSKSINRYTQKIFTELADADKNWIKYIYKAAENDGVSPELFVLDIFQYLLSERLIEDKELLDAIKTYSLEEINEESNPASVSKIFQTLFYTKISKNSPFMTGDICELNDNTFGIAITPECDISKLIKSKGCFYFIKFKESGFKNHIGFKGGKKDENGKMIYYKKSDFDKLETEQLNSLKQIFNQEEQKIHILPSFPEYQGANISVLANFSIDVEKLTYDDLFDEQGKLKLERNYKLNSPFIQQLRQRYIAYFGRVGVPALPEIVRLHNLK